MDKIVFVTGNSNKATETQSILGDIKIVDFDLPEIQGTPEEVANDKCRKAAKIIKGPVLIEDTSLSFDALNGLPGVYIKDFYKKLKNQGLVKLISNYDTNRATARCIFAYSSGPNDQPKLFIGVTLGSIVDPRGSNNFGWDPIFEPLGYQETYAQLDSITKNKISHRLKALQLVKEYFLKKNTVE